MQAKTPTTTPQAARAYAQFTLVIDYTYKAAQHRGKPRQTHRDDLTALNFQSGGMNIENLHPLEILYRKYLQEKLVTYRARMFDNRLGNKREPLVFDIVIENGVIKQYRDLRNEYYDIETGYKWQRTVKEALDKKDSNANAA